MPESAYDGAVSLPTIFVSAVVVTDDHGRVLTVRKRGTSRFMLPGGKPEPGEGARDAAVRECWEEVGLILDADTLIELGRFTAPAANEPDRVVTGDVFMGPRAAQVVPSAEISEVRWLDPDAPLPADLAPMLEHHVLPAWHAAL